MSLIDEIVEWKNLNAALDQRIASLGILREKLVDFEGDLRTRVEEALATWEKDLTTSMTKLEESLTETWEKGEESLGAVSLETVDTIVENATSMCEEWKTCVASQGAAITSLWEN